jgi:hypothetical protein
MEVEISALLSHVSRSAAPGVNHLKRTVTLFVLWEFTAGKGVVKISDPLQRWHPLPLDRFKFASEGFNAADMYRAM